MGGDGEPTSCCECRGFGGGFTPFGGILARGCHEFVGLGAGAGLDSGSKCSGAREGPDRGGHPGMGLLAAPYRRRAQGGAGHGTRRAAEAMGKLRHGNSGAFGVTGSAGGAAPRTTHPPKPSGGCGPLLSLRPWVPQPRPAPSAHPGAQPSSCPTSGVSPWR